MRGSFLVSWGEVLIILVIDVVGGITLRLVLIEFPKPRYVGTALTLMRLIGRSKQSGAPKESLSDLRRMATQEYAAARNLSIVSLEGGTITREIFSNLERVPLLHHLRERCRGHNYPSVGERTVNRIAVCKYCLEGAALEVIRDRGVKIQQGKS